MIDFIRQGNPDIATILLAHGAGAPMDSPFMDHMSQLLAGRGFEVIRFEFPYMAERRNTGKKRPPDRAPKLLDAFESAAKKAAPRGPLLVGGKSMGGRMATLLAAQNRLPISGVLCLGYPFHAPGKPDKLRTDHFQDIKVPTLIVQGTRDPFGGSSLTETLSVPDTIHIAMILDGNHDLMPRKKSGLTHDDNMELAARTAHAFFDSLNTDP